VAGDVAVAVSLRRSASGTDAGCQLPVPSWLGRVIAYNVRINRFRFGDPGGRKGESRPCSRVLVGLQLNVAELVPQQMHIAPLTRNFSPYNHDTCQQSFTY